jgi:cell division septation protein DedD
MLSTQKAAFEYREKLEKLIGMSLDELGQASDRIQKLSRRTPETLALTALCEFSQAQRIRRLLILSPRTWGQLEVRWAKQIVERVAELRNVEGPAAALALACMGGQRKDLKDAMDELNRRAVETELMVANSAATLHGTPAPAEPAPAIEPEKKPAKAKKAAAKAEPKPAPLSSLDELDEETLDPETAAALEALKREVAELQPTPHD